MRICAELPAGSEEHSDYKPADAKDANIKHQLSGTFQYNVWGVVQKPILVHAAQLVLYIGILCVRRFVSECSSLPAGSSLSKSSFGASKSSLIFVRELSILWYYWFFSRRQKYNFCSINENLRGTIVPNPSHFLKLLPVNGTNLSLSR